MAFTPYTPVGSYHSTIDLPDDAAMQEFGIAAYNTPLQQLADNVVHIAVPLAFARTTQTSCYSHHDVSLDNPYSDWQKVKLPGGKPIEHKFQSYIMGEEALIHVSFVVRTATDVEFRLKLNGYEINYSGRKVLKDYIGLFEINHMYLFTDSGNDAVLQIESKSDGVPFTLTNCSLVVHHYRQVMR